MKRWLNFVVLFDYDMDWKRWEPTSWIFLLFRLVEISRGRPKLKISLLKRSNSLLCRQNNFPSLKTFSWNRWNHSPNTIKCFRFWSKSSLFRVVNLLKCFVSRILLSTTLESNYSKRFILWIFCRQLLYLPAKSRQLVRLRCVPQVIHLLSSLI